MLACNDETFDERVKAAVERRNRGISSDEAIELESEDEELVQEKALATDWVPIHTNIWGALRGDCSEDTDMVDFDASTAWVDEEDRLDREEDDAADAFSDDDEEPPGVLQMQNDSYPSRTSSKKLAFDPEGEQALEGDDATDEVHIDDNENEGSEEEQDDSTVGEDIDFLMKYCV